MLGMDGHESESRGTERTAGRYLLTAGAGSSALIVMKLAPRLPECLSSFHSAQQNHVFFELTSSVADRQQRDELKTWREPLTEG
jgi:hypothetical protein